VIAYLPVQAVLTLHVFLLNRDAVMDRNNHRDRDNKGKALNVLEAHTRRETAPGARDLRRNGMIKKIKRKKARCERGHQE
jgi:hypothetical protein